MAWRSTNLHHNSILVLFLLQWRASTTTTVSRPNETDHVTVADYENLHNLASVIFRKLHAETLGYVTLSSVL